MTADMLRERTDARREADRCHPSRKALSAQLEHEAASIGLPDSHLLLGITFEGSTGSVDDPVCTLGSTVLVTCNTASDRS